MTSTSDPVDPASPARATVRGKVRKQVRTGVAGILAFLAALAGNAVAREVTLVTTMAENFRGVGAYVIWYVVDAEGKYIDTIWGAGRSTRYYTQFRHWWRATTPIAKARIKELDGITGPSLAHGEVFELKIDLPDELLDAGYLVKLDSSIQQGRDNASDVIAPLETSNSGLPFMGHGYVDNFVMKF